MKCETCKGEMTITKTTGRDYTFFCFSCGRTEVVEKHPKKPWYKTLLGGLK